MAGSRRADRIRGLRLVVLRLCEEDARACEAHRHAEQGKVRPEHGRYRVSRLGPTPEIRRPSHRQEEGIQALIGLQSRGAPSLPLGAFAFCAWSFAVSKFLEILDAPRALSRPTIFSPSSGLHLIVTIR